jgi:hypothetical protein
MDPICLRLTSHCSRPRLAMCASDRGRYADSGKCMGFDPVGSGGGER